MTTAIKLTLPDTLAEQTKKNVKEFGYSNMQELTLEAIRELNKKLEREAFHDQFYKKGNGRRPTKEERVQAMNGLTKFS